MFLPSFCLRYYLIYFIINSKATAEFNNNVNIMYLNDEVNNLAAKTFDMAINYINNNPDFRIKVNSLKVIVKLNETRPVLDALCKTYSAMLSSNTPPNLVLDYTKNGKGSATAKLFTKSLALPTISFTVSTKEELMNWREASKGSEKYLINISPPGELIPDIIKAIVLHQNISNAAILFDDSFDMTNKYGSLLINMPTKHIIRRVSHDKNLFSNMLLKLLKLEVTNYFFVVDILHLNYILESICSVNNDTKKYALHIITASIAAIKVANASCNYELMVAQPILENKYKERFELFINNLGINAAFYFDMTVKAIFAIKNITADTQKKMKYVTCEDFKGENITTKSLIRDFDLRETINKMNYDYLTSFGHINISSSGDGQMNFQMQLSIFETIRQEYSTDLGSWRVNVNNRLDIKDQFAAMKSFAAETIYVASVVIKEPFVFYNKSAEQNVSGLCIDLMHEIANMLNFKYTLRLPPENKTGKLENNGWDDVIKDLADKRVDIGLGLFFVIAEREVAVEFTLPIYDSIGITILMRTPAAQSKVFQLVSVLENEVWLYCLAIFCCTVFLLYIFATCNPCSGNKPSKHREFNWKECVWFCMMSATPQGGGEAPRSLSGRLVAAAWWFFCFIIISSYAANLAASLSVRNNRIKNLDDLVSQYKIQYSPLNNSMDMLFFERMVYIESRFQEIWKDMVFDRKDSSVEQAKRAVWEYPIPTKYTKMWRVIQEVGPPNSQEEALARIRSSAYGSEGSFALIIDSITADYLQLTNCDLQTVGDPFAKRQMALAVQKGSPLKQQINMAIMELVRSHKLDSMKSKWWTNKANAVKCDTYSHRRESINLESLGGLLLIICTFICVASVILFLDFSLTKCVHKIFKL